MVVLIHPFGNANVRAVLDALNNAGLLERFVTTVGWSKKTYPYLSDHIHGKLRRHYALPADKIDIHPLRESVRFLATALGLRSLVRHERGWASIDQVWQSLDREAARRLRSGTYGSGLRAVYAYEDCAEQSFRAARDNGLHRIYDLPIAYWQTALKLLREEAVRYPDWEPTLGGTRDSAEKCERKTRELELAELVICPSEFVKNTLPEPKQRDLRCVVAPFGSPAVEFEPARSEHGRPLRLLFAGTLTQRKGLADLFSAMKMLHSTKVELVVMGSLLRPLAWYQDQYRHFIYEPPRPHAEVLELMRSCDVLVLPSIVEGRALVQQEAMACGLPLIVTPNAGGEDLINQAETGFLVPIRAPDKIAEAIDWFAANRAHLSGMRIAAHKRARELTWQSYGDRIVAAARELMSE